MSDDLKDFLVWVFFVWSIMGGLTGVSYALAEGTCPRKNFASYLNPVYIASCELLKPRWEK